MSRRNSLHNRYIKSLYLVLLTIVLCACAKSSEDYTTPTPPLTPEELTVRIARPIASELSWEDTVTSIVLFIYRSLDEPSAKPILKYIFSESDIERAYAAIPLKDIVTKSGLDIYAIANSREEEITQNKQTFSRTQLKALTDSAARNRYNYIERTHLKEIISAQGGFTMSSFSTVLPNNEPDITINFDRTVAKIEVVVETDKATFRQDAINRNYPNASIKIRRAWLLRGNRAILPFLPHSAQRDDYQKPYKTTDSLRQANPLISDGDSYNGLFTFHIFPTHSRGTINHPFSTDIGNEALKLRIEFSYYYDNADRDTHITRYFDIAVQGDGHINLSGSIYRNTQYQIHVTILGINGTLTKSNEQQHIIDVKEFIAPSFTSKITPPHKVSIPSRSYLINTIQDDE